MRIALSAVGTRGDVQPMLALGLALRGRGHDVRMCAPPDFHDLVVDVGLPFFPVGHDMHEVVTVLCPDVVRKPLAPLRVMDELIRYQFDDLRKACEGAEVLVAGGVQAAAPSIAEDLGIPYFYAAYTPSVLRSREHPAPIFRRQDRPGWVNELSWWACERLFDFALRKSVNRERERMGLARVDNLYRYAFRSGTTLLATDRLLAPAPQDARVGVRNTGFWFWDDPVGLEPLDPELQAFLADGAPPVYVGFGSMPAEDPARVTRSLVDAVLASGQRAVLHRGWAKLGGDDLPAQIQLVDEVSHPRLFPRVAAVVHHGGAGTTANALRAGVPQVIVPHIVDQYYWAERVCRLGVGPRAMPMKDLDPVRLADAIRVAAQSAGMRDRASEVATMIESGAGLRRAVAVVEAAELG